MNFMGVVMRPQDVEVPVGDFDFGDFFTGEVGREAALPELVGAFDFAFGLRRGGIAQADVVELERPAQLGQRVRIVREKEAVIIDVKLQWAAVRQKSGGQKIKVGKQEFALVELGAGEKAAAVIQPIEHGEGDFGLREPAVRRGVELPEFADLRALPAAHRGQNFFGRDGMGQMVGERPAADLGAVQFEVMQAQGFGSGEAVRTRRRAGQTFFEQVKDGLRPRGGMVAPGSAGRPEGWLFLGARGIASGGENVEAAGRKAALRGGLDGTQRVLAERVEHMADKGGCVTMDELLMLFKDVERNRRPWPHHPSFRRASLRSPILQDGWCGQEDSCFANYTTCPVLLAPRHLFSIWQQRLFGIRWRA